VASNWTLLRRLYSGLMLFASQMLSDYVLAEITLLDELIVS
jgi:hypothetical protein